MSIQCPHLIVLAGSNGASESTSPVSERQYDIISLKSERRI